MDFQQQFTPASGANRQTLAIVRRPHAPPRPPAVLPRNPPLHAQVRAVSNEVCTSNETVPHRSRDLPPAHSPETAVPMLVHIHIQVQIFHWLQVPSTGPSNAAGAKRPLLEPQAPPDSQPQLPSQDLNAAMTPPKPGALLRMLCPITHVGGVIGQVNSACAHLNRIATQVLGPSVKCLESAVRSLASCCACYSTL